MHPIIVNRFIISLLVVDDLSVAVASNPLRAFVILPLPERLVAQVCPSPWQRLPRVLGCVAFLVNEFVNQFCDTDLSHGVIVNDPY